MSEAFRCSVTILTLVLVACSPSPEPPPQPTPTPDPAIERQVGIYAAAVREVLGEPGDQQTARTVWFVAKTDPSRPSGGFGPAIAEEVVDGVISEVEEWELRPAERFGVVWNGGHVKDGGIVVTVSPIRERNGGDVFVGANVFQGEWSGYGSQLVVGFRDGEWRVVRLLGDWIT